MGNPKAEILIVGSTFSFSVGLGDETARPSGGGPQYADEARPERGGLTVYTGDALIKLDVPVLLDGWKAQVDQQPLLNRIISIARGQATGERPPDFIATGPIPFSGLRCVMEQPDFGDRMLGANGVLYRQELTLKLVEFVDPDAVTIERRDAGGAGARGASGSVPIYITKEGDTLIRISTKLYGNPGKAKELGDANGIRDIRKKLKGGVRIKLVKPFPISAVLGRG